MLRVFTLNCRSKYNHTLDENKLVILISTVHNASACILVNQISEDTQEKSIVSDYASMCFLHKIKSTIIINLRSMSGFWHICLFY